MNTPIARRARYKVPIACVTCRRRKLKCDGARPVCQRCKTAKSECTWPSASQRAEQLAERRPASLDNAQPVVNDVQNDTLLRPVRPIEQNNEVPPSLPTYTQENNDPVQDARRHINARLVDNNPKIRCPLPLIDAPLFAVHPLAIPASDSNAHDTGNANPSRRQADLLMNLYWQHLEHLEPLFDRSKFFASYRALYSDNRDRHGADDTSSALTRQIFLITLNTVFALTTQINEALPEDERNATAQAYFLRAEALLPMQAIWHGQGGLDIAQCLVLMTRFLRGTVEVQRTRIMAGMAMRVAEGLNLGVIPASTEDEALRTVVCLQCIFMERDIAHALGGQFGIAQRVKVRRLGVSDELAPSWEVGAEIFGPFPGMPKYYIGSWTVWNDLHEEIVLFHRARTNGSRTSGRDIEKDTTYDAVESIAQIDQKLTQLEETFRNPLEGYGAMETDTCGSTGQRMLFQLRILQLRIMLLRPTLIHYSFCVLSPETAPDGVKSELRQRGLQTCAQLCVGAAVRMAEFVKIANASEEVCDRLPWWYRVYFLHMAGQQMLTATIRADGFSSTLETAIENVSALLAAHAHLSLAVRRDIEGFEKLRHNIRVVTSDHATASTPEEFSTMMYDICQHLSFDPNDPLFDVDISLWLTENLASAEQA